MRFLLTVAIAAVLGLGQQASAIAPPCDTETASGTGDVCVSTGEELNTQSFKRSFVDSLTGSLCTDADKGAGSLWIAGDFVGDPTIGYLPLLCLDNSAMTIDEDYLVLPHGTLRGAARRAAAAQTVGLSEYACATEADAGRFEVNSGSDPPYFKWCHWDGATASDKFVAIAESDGTPTSIGTTAAMDSTCDATGTFSNGATVITLADYSNTFHKSTIAATVSFTAAVANTFTIKAKIDGSQVGPDVTCSAAAGFSASCAITILDDVDDPSHTFTVTASQSVGILNTVDTCNVTRLSVHR